MKPNATISPFGQALMINHCIIVDLRITHEYFFNLFEVIALQWILGFSNQKLYQAALSKGYIFSDTEKSI